MSANFKYIRDEEKRAIRDCFDGHDEFLELPTHIQNTIINELEKSCNNATYDRAVLRKLPQIWDDPRYVEIYSNIGYNLKVNLDPNSSINVSQPDAVRYYVINSIIWHYKKIFLRKLGTRKYPSIPWDNILSHIHSTDPSMIAYKDGHEINPSRSQKYIDEINLREQQKIDKKFTTQFRCPQCGVSRATFKSVQSRGLDEDNTLYILCDNCGHRWTKN